MEGLETPKYQDMDDFQGDSSDSDEDKEKTKVHRVSRLGRLPTPFFVPTFFTVNSGQLLDGTQVSQVGDLVTEHTYSLSWIQKVYVTLEYPSSSGLGYWIGWGMQFVIILNIITGVIASSPRMLYQPSTCSSDDVVCNNDSTLCPGVTICSPITKPVLGKIDEACFIVFAIDYFLRLFSGFFTPPRITNLLHDEWDRGEVELMRQTKRTIDYAVEKELREKKQPLTDESKMMMKYDKLLQYQLKNGPAFYCSCSLFKKLTINIMVSMGRSWDTSVHQLGTQQLIDFKRRLALYESEFIDEFRLQRGWCGDPSLRAVDELDNDDAPQICRGCCSSKNQCSPKNQCPDNSCDADGKCSKGSCAGGCEPSSRNRFNSSEDDEDNNLPYTDHLSSTHVVVDLEPKGWTNFMKKLEQERPTQSFFGCTPVRNRLGLREAWILEVDSHFSKVCRGCGISPEEVAPSCVYDDNLPRSDPDWPYYDRALRWIFSLQNMIDFASIMPLFLQLVIKGGGSAVSTTFLRVVRCFRLVRVIKLNPYSAATIYLLKKTMINSAETLAYLMLVAIILGVLFAFIMHQLESGIYTMNSDFPEGSFIRPQLGGGWQTSPFESVGVSLYYVFVTMTTLGYGDIYPTSAEGRVLASIIAFSGVLFIALPTSVVSNNFGEQYALYKKNRESLLKDRRRHEMYEMQKSKARRKHAEQRGGVHAFEGFTVLRRVAADLVKDTPLDGAVTAVTRLTKGMSNLNSGSGPRKSVSDDILRHSKKKVERNGTKNASIDIAEAALLASSFADSDDLYRAADEIDFSPVREQPLKGIWRLDADKQSGRVALDQDQPFQPTISSLDQWNASSRFVVASASAAPQEVAGEAQTATTSPVSSVKTSLPSPGTIQRKRLSLAKEEDVAVVHSAHLTSAKTLRRIIGEVTTAHTKSNAVYEKTMSELLGLLGEAALEG